MVVKVADIWSDPPTIAKHFVQMTDPRMRTLRYHKFMDILVIGIYAVICGADDYEAMKSRMKSQQFPNFCGP